MAKVDAEVPPEGGGPASDPTVKVHRPTTPAEHADPMETAPVEPDPPGKRWKRSIALSGAATALVAGVVTVAVLGGGSGTITARQGSATATSGTAGPAPGVGAGVTRDVPGSGAENGTSPSGSSSPGGPTASAAAQTATSGGPAQNGHAATTAATPAGQAANPRAAAPAYLGRLASLATGSASTAPVPLSGGSPDGAALVLSVMLTNTHSGTVSAHDSAGNVYTAVVDQSDLAGDRTLVLVATGARALTAGGTVTLSFPATEEEHVALDAFSGVHTVAGSNSHEAKPPGDFASGYAALPSGGGIAFEAAGLQGGSTASWSGGVTALPTLVVAPADQLATAYIVAGGAGSYQAAGTCTHQWMAAVVTLA